MDKHKMVIGKMMQLSISEIKPNEFKKKINDGKLNEEQVQSIMGNMDELGLMGALPVYEKGGVYRLVNGHHRLEAMRRKFGKDVKVPVVVHDFSEEAALKGMVVENLTQRSGEFREEEANVVLVREWLQKHPDAIQALKGVGKRKDGRALGDNQIQVPGSVPSIHTWLKGVMSIGRIQGLLSIHDNLDEEIKEQVVKKKTQHDEEGIGVELAASLSRYSDKTEQKDLLKAIESSREQGGHEKKHNLALYNEASEEIKQKVRKSEIDIADINTEVQNQKFKGLSKEIADADDNAVKIMHTKEIVAEIRREISDTQNQLRKMMTGIEMVRRTKFYFATAPEKKSFFEFVKSVNKEVKNWSEKLDQIANDLEMEVA